MTYDAKKYAPNGFYVLNEDGEPQKGYEPDGAQRVSVQNPYSHIVDLPLITTRDTFATIAAVSPNDKSIQIETTGYAPVTGDTLYAAESATHKFCVQRVLSSALIAGNQYTITVDTPYGNVFPAGLRGRIGKCNMAVNGSVTPQLFSVAPLYLDEGYFWDITRIVIVIISSAAMDDSKFGSLTALTNGVVLRRADNTGTFCTIFNVKTNGDFAVEATDAEYPSKVPAGVYSFRVKRNFLDKGANSVAVRLYGATIGSLEMLIQDDLSGLASMRAVAQGHVSSDFPNGD